MALEQEYQFLLKDLQQVNVEKAQQHEDETHMNYQFEVTPITLPREGLGAPKLPKEHKVSLLTNMVLCHKFEDF